MMNENIRKLYPFIWGIALVVLLSHGTNVVAGVVNAIFILGAIAFVLINVSGLPIIKYVLKQDMKNLVITEVVLVYIASITFTVSLLICMPSIMAGDMSFLEPKYWVVNINLILGLFTLLRFLFQMFLKDVFSD